MRRISRRLPWPVVLAFAVALPTAVLASSPAEEAAKKEAGKSSHFEVPLPATTAAAVELLKANMLKIEAANGKADFDAIHEATYSVESAIARIAQDPGYDGLKTTVAPRVEIVHLASEQKDAETLKAAVPILSKSVNDQLQALIK
jgi:hypothetical protein